LSLDANGEGHPTIQRHIQLELLNGGDAFTMTTATCRRRPILLVAPATAATVQLVVIADHLDMRGWKSRSWTMALPGHRSLHRGSGMVRPGAGTIITISEDVADDAAPTRRTATGGSACAPLMRPKGGTGRYISAADFSVSNDDWQLRYSIKAIRSSSGLRGRRAR
jgi:hypothetical protein